MHKVLFVELLGGIGDVLIALKAIHALARSHPAAEITVLTLPPGGELLQSDPQITQVIYADRDNPRKSIEVLLSRHSFDLIVSDTNYDGIAHVIQNSGVSQVVTNLWRQPPPDQQLSDRFLQILLAEGLIEASAISAPHLHLATVEQRRAQEAFDNLPRPLVFLCPDAGMRIKHWSPANFVTLGKTLQQWYGATVIVPVGSDFEQAAGIVDEIGSGAQILPRGKLRDLAAAIACADLMVAADTGPARIAAALNVPTVTLFGPSWHGRYGQPLPHINLQGYPECPERNISNFTEQRCWYGVCPLEKNWQTCVEAISPAEVLAAVKPLLGARSREETVNYPLPAPLLLNNKWAKARNILVMRLDNIGDVIMASPALRAIKENLPECHLTLMASPGGAQTASLLPWVDEVLPWRVLWQDLGKLDFNPAREWELVKTLQSGNFDAAIIFTSFSQSPHPAGFLCYLAGIPLRLGESKELGDGVLTTEIASAADEMHQVERNLQLIEAVGFEVRDRSLGIGISAVAQQEATQLLAQHGISAATPYLLLNPWTSCQSRNYDTQRFAIAARQLAETTNYPVVVTGVPQDRQRSDSLLAALAPYAIDLIGTTTLPQLAALIASAQLVLTNNTSTMHIADATRTPSVVMFAGTEYESQWRPRHTLSRLLRRPTSCSPCYAFTCPYQLECLDIPPEEVVAVGLELLELTNL